MSELMLRVFERVHGHLGWLSTLALLHPSLLLRTPRRPTLLVATIATLLVSVTAGLGLLLYPDYREKLKPLIYAHAAFAGDLFERKEHLAVAAVVLAWVGLVSNWAEQGAAGAPRSGVAKTAYTCASALAIVVGTLGVAVAVERSF